MVLALVPKKAFVLLRYGIVTVVFSDPKLLKSNMPGLILEDSIYKAFNPEV